MGYGFGTDSGGLFISSVVSEEVYDPVFDVPVDASFLFQLIPDFYRNLMDDQDIFLVLWSSFMQQVSGDLLNLWQIDYAKSLHDVPVIAQRKWVQLDLIREYDLKTDPVLSFGGLGATLFVYDDVGFELDGTYQNRTKFDSAYIPLRGEVNELGSLSFSVVLNIESAERFSAALFGYLSSAEQLSNAFVVAVLGDETTADAPRPAILHFDSAGNPTVSISGFPLSIDTQYRFDFSYTASTGVAILEVTELRYLKASGTHGQVPSAEGDILTNFFVDDTVNFDTLGIVPGDLLLVLGLELEILSVDGSLLTTKVTGLPVDVSGLTYQILGEVLVTSCSLDLAGDASDPTFTCTRFGTGTLDIRSTTSAIFSTLGALKLKRMEVSSKEWAFLDPCFEVTTLTIPRLQDKITSPSYVLTEGTDFNLRNSTIYFQEPPAEGLWAEYVGYDEGYIQDNFGSNVGLLAESSDQYKARVRGLYYAYWQGPTVSAIQQGVHIFVGLPIAEKAGTVEAINTSFSGTLGLITVAGIEYLFPLLAGTSLVVGDAVELFAPLCNGVEIVDYLIDPEWFVNLSINELRKFHTFVVRLNLDAFELDTLVQAAEFVDRIKPTWKQALFLAFKALVDDVIVDDALGLKVTLKLYDEPCEFFVAYDSYEYEGDEADWKYDQGLVDWEETSAAMRGSSTPLTGTVALTNSSTGAVGTGTTFLADIGGPGPMTDKFLAVGLYTTSAQGVTTASSNEFNDPSGALAAVEVGDHIDISGEGIFEILFTISSTQVILDAPTAATATGVSWANSGKLGVWGEVASVATNTALTFSVAFTGITGTYLVALLDNHFKEVFYDQFEEQCPDEAFTLNITYTGGAAPFGPVTVPAASGTTAHVFPSSPSTYSVTLAERVP